MKKLLALIAIAASLPAYSQIDHIKIVLGQTDKQVTNYSDSLFSLKSNPYYKVDRSVTDYGDLMLITDFALADEAYYQCLTMITVFDRVQGVEYCVKQVIDGSVKYAQSNLAYIKDNFKFVSDGKWEKPFAGDFNAKIVATFKRDDTNPKYPTYVITYELIPVK